MFLLSCSPPLLRQFLHRAPSSLPELPRAIQEGPPQNGGKSGHLLLQWAAAETPQHYSVDATVTCQGPPDNGLQFPPSGDSVQLSTDCPDKDDDIDSTAPDVVAHIIIRTVPDSAAN